MPVLDWITEKSGLARPSEGTEVIVAEFTMMWAFFEACYPRDINFASIKRKIEPLEVQDHDVLRELHAFLAQRYTGEHPPRDFNALAWRPSREDQRAKDFTNQVLSTPAPTAKEILEAGLYIAYRVRNNLFHGMKAIPALHESTELFQQMINLLQHAYVKLDLFPPDAP